MDSRYADIQARYLAELRSLMPGILEWWDERAGTDPDAPNDFDRRWPAGPVAHPRVLEVVRRHYLEVEELNVANESDPPEDASPIDEASWGATPPPPVRAFVRPIDLLVNDLEHAAPDLIGIMGALVLVPVGTDRDGELA